MKPFRAVLRVTWALMMMVSISSCRVNNDFPVDPTPDPSQLSDYTIIYYGHGGGNLDAGLFYNLRQFYQGKAESYEHVSIVSQYKFSTAENLVEKKFFTEEYRDYHFGSRTVRMIIDPTKTVGGQLFNDDNFYGDDNANVACPDSLTNFINWAAKVCPAKNYILILSDHGSGYTPDYDLPEQKQTRGVMFDDAHDGVHFSVSSLHRALANANVHLQTIYLDACMMNTIEYQFELKDLADYYILSTFYVPGYGGRYDILVDELGEHPNDIETALSNFSRETTNFWDDNTHKFDYHDMSVIRTSELDAFGRKFRTFTDKLVSAYQSGDEELKQKIDACTASAFRIQNSSPSYDIVDYYTRIYLFAPGVIDEPFFNELEDAFNRTVICKHTSKFLESNGYVVDCSIMLCNQGTYRRYDYEDDGNGGWKLNYFFIYEPDGKWGLYWYESKRLQDYGSWGGTLDSTYGQLAFDRATGWSRWLWLNEQEPNHIALADFYVDIPGELGKEQ